MEIVGSFRSWSDEMLSYVRSRFPLWAYVPLALFLWIAGLAGGRPAGGADVAYGFGLACSLLFQFRLWDDLADRERDEKERPGRVLIPTTHRVSFHTLALLAFLLNIVLILLRVGLSVKLLAFLLLSAALLTWYRFRPRWSANPILEYHVVLAKYPVFAYLLSEGSTQAHALTLLASMAVVYLCFCIYEVLHDARLHEVRGVGLALATEMCGLVTILVLTALVVTSGGGSPSLLRGAFCVASALCLLALFKRYCASLRPGLWNHAVFVIGVLQVATFSLGADS
jgi:4-hydroxybenzoate polyprenyltransferase